MPVSFAFNKHVELLGDAAGSVYVGDGTASLEKINPLDLSLGMRAFLFERRVDLFRGVDRRTPSVLECVKIVKPAHYPPPQTYGGVTPPPPPPKIECSPKQVVLATAKDTDLSGSSRSARVAPVRRRLFRSVCLKRLPRLVNKGERVSLAAKVTTPGYSDDKIAYEYTWEVRDPNGLSVSINGSGATIEIPPGQLVCGIYLHGA